MRLALIGVLAGAFLVGCGGSDSDDDGSRSTAAAYVRRVDALCREATPKLEAIMTSVRRARDAARAGEVGIPETLDKFETLLGRAETILERQLGRLRAISPPSGERAFHDDLVRSVERGSLNLRQQVRTARAGDASRLSRLSIQGSVLNARTNGLLSGHGGFRHCGRG